MPIVSIETFAARRFDYLIIGGGTAGLVLATRLSEDENVSVGVIEAGGNDSDIPEIMIPGLMGATIANPAYDWSFSSVPQARAGGRKVLQPRGKGLGGSSMINFMGMFRPSEEELDALEELGNEGWNWASLLEYMKKSETVYPGKISSADAERYGATPDLKFHGTSGPIKKSFPTVWTEPHALLFDAAAELGVPRNGEMGDGSNVGSMTSFTSIDPANSKRSYSAADYYAPNANRTNLHILLNTQVCKIILERSSDGTQRATGVNVVHDGVSLSLQNIADEIVLSAGAFQTPQLLELSGIGDPSVLQKYGIAPAIDLPGVGENLQDHVCIRRVVEIDSKFETMDILSEPAQLAKHQELYKEQKGLLSSVPAVGFIFLSNEHLKLNPDQRMRQNNVNVQLASELDVDFARSASVLKGLQKQYDLQASWSQKTHLAQAEVLIYIGHQRIPGSSPVPGKRYISLVSALMHPLSRGSVHIASSDPLAPPSIDPSYFSNEADLDQLVRIFQFTTKLLGTSPMAGIVRGDVIPGSEVMQPVEGLEDRLRDYIRNNCGPIFHPVGTAAMLPFSDGGVVDANLKVYGTTNLHVVDVSILPMELSCHIQSLAYAIGEKAADILKMKQVR